MRGHKQRRGPKTWRLYVSGDRDPLTNKRRLQTRTFHGTEREAETALARFVIEISEEMYGDVASITVTKLVTRWFKYATPNLTENTIRGYRSKIDSIIKPLIGDIVITKVNAELLDGLYNQLLAGGPDRKKLSANSVRRVHAILSASFEQAIRWDWMKTNPCVRARQPIVPEPEAPDISPELVAKMLRDAPAEPLGDISYLAAATGLRVGELCALRWSDLDAVARSLAVRRRVMHDGTVRARTKNNRTRVIGLDRRTTARLRLRHYRARRRMRACELELTDDAFIFSEALDGLTPVSPATISQRWKMHRQKMGVALRFHDLRHFHLSVLLDAGVPIGRVSQRAGHSRQSTTLNIYSHVMRASDHDLAGTVSDALRPKKK